MKWILGFVGSVLCLGLVGYAIARMRPEPPPVEPEPSLESCFQQVFKSAVVDKQSGLVNAAVAYVDGKIDTKSESERQELYRQLDSAEVRLAINGCVETYRQRPLEARPQLNLRARNEPLRRAEVTIRNQSEQPVLTDDAGKAFLPLRLESIETDLIPLAIAWSGAHFDIDTKLSELELGKPIDVGHVGTLEVQVVGCDNTPVKGAAQVTLHLDGGSSARAWPLEGPHGAGPGAPIRSETSSGIARFAYQGDLGAFGVSVQAPSGKREEYVDQQAALDYLELRYPKLCDRPKPPPPPKPCPELERLARDALGKRNGTRWKQVTVTPTPSGFRCSASVCGDIAPLFSPGLARCRSFKVKARVD